MPRRRWRNDTWKKLTVKRRRSDKVDDNVDDDDFPDDDNDGEDGGRGSGSSPTTALLRRIVGPRTARDFMAGY
jgi:hypothetical protein